VPRGATNQDKKIQYKISRYDVLYKFPAQVDKAQKIGREGYEKEVILFKIIPIIASFHFFARAS